jgi:hypothetical protein
MRKMSLARPVIQTLSNGSVLVRRDGKTIALVTPEIFTEGWAKNALSPRRKARGYHGVVPLAGQDAVGLQTNVVPMQDGTHLRFTLIPLGPVKVIHIRMVVNLPYLQWQGARFRLGVKRGKVPVSVPKNNRLAEAASACLLLGPSSAIGGLSLRMRAPGLHTVLQDNRQWTPFLHAFVTCGEKSDPPWTWKKGRPKTYRFDLSWT